MKIHCLIENSFSHPNLVSEHGLSLLIEACGKRILFDTGASPAFAENAAKMGGSQVFLEAGEEMSLRDMLKSVVIASANDAAVALMGDDYKNAPALAIPESVKSNYFLQLDIGDAAKTYDKYWTMLMSEEQ